MSVPLSAARQRRSWQGVIAIAAGVLVHGTGVASSSERAPALMATTFRPVYPLLIRNAHAPMLRVTFEVPAGEAVTLHSLTVSLAGTDNLADLDELAWFATGEREPFATSAPVGKPLAPARELHFAVQRPLQPGHHVFWLACRLNEKADLRRRVMASCTLAETSAGSLVPRDAAPGQRQRIGVALRRRGDDGVHTYRIPALTVTARGTLLCVYDMRRRMGRDLQEDIDIGLSRSTDGGQTWEPVRVIMDMGEYGGLPPEQNGCSDPGIVVDRVTGEIFCFAVWMNGKPGKHQWTDDGSEPGFEIGKSAQFQMVRSRDDGATWTPPENLTRQLKQPQWWLLAPSPQSGFQLPEGTLVMPVQGRAGPVSLQNFATIMTSRDHGQSWTVGAPGYVGGSECQAARLGDGSIMLNVRNNREKYRAVVVSSDLGQTWRDHPTSRNTLIEPTCNGSLLRVDYEQAGKAGHVLVFANPHTQSGRTHHTIQISFDDGMTWPASHHRLLDEGRGAGYPSLAQVDKDHVGIVYEGSQSHLVFQKFAIAELLEPVGQGQPADATKASATTFSVRIDRGADRGQSFGSLFEVTSRDGSYTVGAGFPNLYNTRYRGDRHAVQFFVRPNREGRPFTVKPLPRPNDLCGTYLFGRDGTVYSTYGGIKAWDPAAESWREAASAGGTDETVRVGDGELVLGDSRVHYNGKLVLAPPSSGSYQLFYYAHGHLCFYHVQRGEGPYRPYRNDEDGFSRLYACPWTPADSQVDLNRAVTLTLPIVGETTFAWGHLGKQIVTGSNIGGFYVFEAGTWRTLRSPQLGVSYQLYSTMAFHDQLLMGQYPTGRIFEYDGKQITDRAGWPPKLPGVSGSAREAQTSVIYGGEVLVGVWPWGELWRYNPGNQTWSFMQRMFDHPELSETIVHPYDVENRGHAVGNLWGQRVTSLVPNGSDLFVSTSAKSPHEWDAAQFPFLAPDRWRSYGTVYRLTMPGHLSVSTAWTDGWTTLEFTIESGNMRISQDGLELGRTELMTPLADSLVPEERAWGEVTWGAGIYGRSAGVAIDGSIRSNPSAP